MKKLVGILLIAVMLMSAVSVSAFANIISGDYLYEDKFVESFVTTYGDEEPYYAYEEIYYHYVDENDPDSKIDWVLVSATNMNASPWGIKEVVGDRVFFAASELHPFRFNYGVYNVNSGYFFQLEESVLESFTDLAQVLDELKIGYPIGDADLDRKLSIMDATYVQQVAASLAEYDGSDDISGYHDFGGDLNYISDMNRDGVRSVLDATAIQMKLAKAEA